jgi:hypothetical protein
VVGGNWKCVSHPPSFRHPMSIRGTLVIVHGTFGTIQRIFWEYCEDWGPLRETPLSLAFADYALKSTQTCHEKTLLRVHHPTVLSTLFRTQVPTPKSSYRIPLSSPRRGCMFYISERSGPVQDDRIKEKQDKVFFSAAWNDSEV